MSKYKYKLALCIVTANRPLQVLNGVRRLQYALEKFNIGVYILDGSMNSLTYNKIKDYAVNNDNVFYSFFGSEVEANYLRYYSRWTLPDAEYIWTCSDQRFPTPGLLFEVLKLTMTTPELIVINTIEKRCTANRNYKDAAKFFRDCCWQMQVMGANVIHKSLLENSWNLEECKEQLLFEPAHTETRQILYAIASKPKGSFLFTKYLSDAYLSNIKNTLSGTIANDAMFLNFIDRIIKSINNLPKIYDKYKLNVIKSMSTKTFWFTIDGFCELQNLGILHTKQCFEYYQRLKKVTYVHPIVVIIISLMPKSMVIIIRDWIRKGREWKNRKY